MHPENRINFYPERLAVKFGTNNLCIMKNGISRLDKKIFDDYAKQIVTLQNQGVQIIVVSSGAYQAGLEYLTEIEINPIELTKKDICGIGQPRLMDRWNTAITEAHGLGTAQLLVTYTNWSNEKERENIRDSIFHLLRVGITPVINENDPIADDEIVSMERRIGENDRLNRMIAILMNAGAALFLTDEGGIYTADPSKNSKAQLLEEIPFWTQNRPQELLEMFGTSYKGTMQGMKAKWIEASRCYKKGMLAAIAGRGENVILNFAYGKSVGTMIGTTLRVKELN